MRYIIIVLFFITLLLNGCKPTECVPITSQDSNSLIAKNNADDIKNLVKELSTSSDRDSADEAYRQLFKKGKSAIPYLIDNADNNAPFNGRIHANILSSRITLSTVGEASMYIIEGILKLQLHPHLNATLYDSNDRSGYYMTYTKVEILQKAKKAHEIWWERNKSRPLIDIINEDNEPLKGTGLYWY